MPAAINLIGSKFGRCLVIGHSNIRSSNGQLHWKCICDCGSLFEPQGALLRRGDTRSCGCLNVETAKKGNSRRIHSASRSPTPEYISWQQMRQRCTNPNVGGYRYWGGAGVKICDSWMEDGKGFSNFLADMGHRPTRKHTLDRFPNPNGNYEPGNCRWTTRKEQRRNRR